MKAFIIYNNTKKSMEYANHALDSFGRYDGWEPELFEGISPESLGGFEKANPLRIKENSRALCFYKERHKNKTYFTKKSCSMNHYRLFKRCIELNEPISVIEHDSHCISDWPNTSFDDILILNVQSAIKQETFDDIRNLNSGIIQEGVSDFCYKGLHYRHDPEINGEQMMPGTAAYSVTPQGAQKMLKVYESVGWEQSDFIINSAYVRLQAIVPEIFTFKLPNLQTSHG